MPRLFPALLTGAALVFALGTAPAPAMAQKCPPGQAQQGKCSLPGKPGKQGQAAAKAEAEKAKPAPKAGGPKAGGPKAGGPKAKDAAKRKAEGAKPKPGAKRPDAKRKAAAKPARPKPRAAVAAGIEAPTSRGGVVALGGAPARDRYQLITDPKVFNLGPAAAGSAYYIVGDRIVRADRRSYQILDVVRPITARDCPPGLAKKIPACIPPGQAKKIMATKWAPDRFVPIRDLGKYDLPRPDGNWDYYVVDGAIVRVDRTTRDILGLVRLIDNFVN